MFRSPLIDAAVILLVILLFVGPKKLPQLGRGLGQGMREFKEGITGESKPDDESPQVTQAAALPHSGQADAAPQPAKTPTSADAGTEQRS